MVSLITDKLGRQTLQDVDREPLLPEVYILTSTQLRRRAVCFGALYSCVIAV